MILTATTQEEYYTIIRSFFSTNYKELEQMIKKNLVNTDYQFEDVLSELYIYLIQNQKRIEQLIEVHNHNPNFNKKSPLLRFSSQWVYNQIRLYSANNGLSNFKGKFDAKKESTTFDSTKYDKPQEENIYNDDDRLELIQEVIQNDLNEVEKKLFQLHFIQQLKKKNIKLMIPEISKYSYSKMIKELQQKIKEQTIIRQQQKK